MKYSIVITATVEAPDEATARNALRDVHEHLVVNVGNEVPVEVLRATVHEGEDYADAVERVTI